jgi:hypothetical protein
MDDLLFSKAELQGALGHQAERVRQAVESVPDEHLRQADVDEWVAALAEEFHAEAPELNVAEMYREPVREIRIDVSHDPSRYFRPTTTDRRVGGYQVVVRIPFTGDAAVFGLRPSQFTFNPPRGRVIDRELAYTVEYPQDAAPDIDAQVNDFVRTVQQWLGFARANIEEFNRTLGQTARAAIEERRGRIDRRDAHLATSSIPERRPGSGGKTYIPEVIVRRPAPRLPTATARDGGDVRLDPALEGRIFDHILSVVRMQAREMERSPNTYGHMDEEARRDVFLATLNTHYEGRGAAEAFNASGKTDILIRFEDRNLFIGECKFWGGVKGFTSAVDQLFGYTTWRDTKLAVVIFVREKGLTEIVETGREALQAHPQFVAWQDAASETELRATVSWRGDESRRADLAVFFVHTPS